MSTGTLILLIILICILLYFIIAMIIQRKRNKKNEPKLIALFDPLEEALIEEQEKNNYHFTNAERILTDQEEPFIVARDNKKHMGAISGKDGVKIFKFHDVKEIKIEEKSNNNISIKLELNEEELTYDIATKGYSKNSLTRKVFLNLANRFIAVLTPNK